MIRLRFVEEYRGRRIVTNGRMYGVQGELVTDCRYLTVAGARAAIDSEANVAGHKKNLDRQRRDFYEYVESEGRGSTFGCNCGWRGSFDELQKDSARHALRCPKCANEGVCTVVGHDAPDD